MERTSSYAQLIPPHPRRGVPGANLLLDKTYLSVALCYFPSLTLDYPGRLNTLTQLISMKDNTPRIPDSLDMQRLQAMQLVARMKETSDRLGMGFIGGFIAPNGEKFVMSNMDDDDYKALMPEDLK